MKEEIKDLDKLVDWQIKEGEKFKYIPYDGRDINTAMALHHLSIEILEE